jgi:prephenate dehydrogenase
MAVGARKRVVVVGLGMVGISFMYVWTSQAGPSIPLTTEQRETPEARRKSSRI